MFLLWKPTNNFPSLFTQIGIHELFGWIGAVGGVSVAAAGTAAAIRLLDLPLRFIESKCSFTEKLQFKDEIQPKQSWFRGGIQLFLMVNYARYLDKYSALSEISTEIPVIPSGESAAVLLLTSILCFYCSKVCF